MPDAFRKNAVLPEMFWRIENLPREINASSQTHLADGPAGQHPTA